MTTTILRLNSFKYVIEFGKRCHVQTLHFALSLDDCETRLTVHEFMSVL